MKTYRSLAPIHAVLLFTKRHYVELVSILKAYADDKLNVAEMIISFFDRVENIVGKGENADFSAFSPFPTTFSISFYQGVC